MTQASGAACFDDQCMATMMTALTDNNAVGDMMAVIDRRLLIFEENHVMNLFIDLTGALGNIQLRDINTRRLTKMIWSFSKLGSSLLKKRDIRAVIISLVHEALGRFSTQPDGFDYADLTQASNLTHIWPMVNFPAWARLIKGICNIASDVVRTSSHWIDSHFSRKLLHLYTSIGFSCR